MTIDRWHDFSWRRDLSIEPKVVPTAGRHLATALPALAIRES